MLVPLNITGGTYKHKSLPLSAQLTRNFYPQKQQNISTKSPYVLECFPGRKVFASISGSRDRGLLEHNGVLYKITDNTLYTVDSAGAATSRGAIAGSARCVMVGIGEDIVIVSAGTAYYYDTSTTTLSTITDVDLETPNGAAHLNNQIIYDGDGGRFGVSDVGDATSINSLNYATAESSSDDLVRAYVFNQILYLLGEKTTEPWINSGVGKPPFDRIENGIITVGLAAFHSVANSVNFMYFLGTDNQVYAIQGTTAEPIMPQPLVHEISDYSLISDAHSICFNLLGQWIYLITFPTADKSFGFLEGSGEWFEVSTGSLGGKSDMSSYAYAFRKHLVGDSNNGNIYELDDNTYTDKGTAIIRIRDTAPLHGGLIGKPGKQLTMNRFELIMEMGVGLVSGQGQDPVVMLSWSDDGGKTFSTERWGKIGEGGQFLKRVEWFCLGSFESRVMRVRCSDPVYFSIHAAAADIEIGI